MATRKAAKRRTTGKRKPARRSTAKRQPTSPAVREALIALGRQALTDGVREVLEGHGVDSSVKVEMILTTPKRRKAAKRTTKARKATTRRR